jgi:thiol-disulfide isomerase/thioredoxin
MKKTHWIGLILIGGVIIGFSIGAIFFSPNQNITPSRETPLTGDDVTISLPTQEIIPLMDIQLNLVDGSNFDFSEHVGVPMLVNIWASWCNPCVEEIPLLEDVSRIYNDQLIVVGINSGELRSTVSNFIEEYEITYPIGMDTDYAITSGLGINVLPTTYLVDRNGNIIEVYFGPLDRDTINDYLVELGIQP